MPTLAEDLALLLVDPATGKPLVDGTAFDRVIGGALLLDLAGAGRLTVSGTGSRARITVVGEPTGDALLDAAAERLGTRRRRAASAVERLSSKLRAATFDRLATAGIVAGETSRVLGVFPATTWRFVDPAPRAALHSRVASALAGKTDPDERTAALVSLLYAVKAEHKVVDGPRRELRARAKQIAEGDWAGSAVAQAVQAVRSTIMSAVVASSIAGAASSTQ
ncbi:GOLPH3/VPS74 family protein [Pseudonocardia sp. CA-107938]|uniref:GOLPH3/VPS74 family protein n=1 Tax=Pseudonocardia sp. CA-107938 TaxID=3240021 RepID=UPI003D8EB8EC